MNQPTKQAITQKLEAMFSGTLVREAVCDWARTYIANDAEIAVRDIAAWHYLVAISGIDEQVSPGQYLFSEEDIRSIMDTHL